VAKYGSPSVTINFDKSDGTTVVDVSQYITEINDVDVEALMEETHTFGDSWTESTPVGLRKMADIKLTGFYDDTATTGPDALFNAVASSPSSTTRTLQIVYGGTKSTSVETHIQKYSRKLDRGKLHKFTVTLQPTGTLTEA